MIYLIIAAHPDDEVLGCGGSIAKWVKDGHEVHVLIMAEGATSRDKHRDRASRKETLSILAQSAKRAAEILGVKSVELLDYPDNRMDSVDLLDVVKTIEDYTEKLKPDVVVTHHSGDLNIDHQITHQAVITACRPQPGQAVKRILSFEIPSSTDWQSPNDGRPFVPNWFEDITDTLPMKMKALEAYQSEMRKWPHARSIKADEHLARWRGASMGYKAAEAFMLVRNIS
ncbi:MAG: PIG-L deacetylase family protein [Fidelibacterota bacterium]